MASISCKNQKKSKKNIAYLLGMISFFAFVIILGAKAVYAYYHNDLHLSILAHSIGDFDIGDGDINLMIYKENEEGQFVRSYAVPEIGYVLDTSPTTKNKCTIPCDTNPSSACHYSYNESTKKFSITSNERVTCKFYFKKDPNVQSDINIYMVRQDADGTISYGDKNYTVVDGVPAYGYRYIDAYTCTTPGVTTLTYNSELKRFTVNSSAKNTCYAYFDFVGNADVLVNVKVQASVGSAVYKDVEFIPPSTQYEKSRVKTSKCYNDTNNNVSATINYDNGYVSVTTGQKATCDVYLDIVV